MRDSPLPGDIASALRDSRVGVAGLGGMGSHIAEALVRSGVGRLTIADFDSVDATNLFRQCYLPSDVGLRKTEALANHLREIEPDVRLDVFDGRITEDNACDVFDGCSVVCEAFDRPDQKAMLAEALLSGDRDVIVVSCSGMAGLGSSNLIHTEKAMRRLYVCGDGVSDVSDSPGLTAARVMVCAGHAANMALRLLLGEQNP